MDLLYKINSIIRQLERYGHTTISRQSILREMEEIAKFFLDLNCISEGDKIAGKKLFDISQKYKQSKKEILNLLRLMKKILSNYEIKKELENQVFKPGKVIIYKAGENYSAYDQLKKFFQKAKNKIDIIDPYLYPQTFQILKCVNNKMKIRLLTDLMGFYKGSKIDFNNFKKEYSIEARDSQFIHDRFFIIDNEGYFSGSSLHGVGNKLSAIAIMDKNDAGMLQKEFDKIWDQSKKIQ